MKPRFKTLLIALILPLCMYALGDATLKLSQRNLMHETRSTPSPLNNATVIDKNVSFMWPLANYMLYYTEGRIRLDKPKEDALNYRIRFSKTRHSKRCSMRRPAGRFTTPSRCSHREFGIGNTGT